MPQIPVSRRAGAAALFVTSCACVLSSPKVLGVEAFSAHPPHHPSTSISAGHVLGRSSRPHRGVRRPPSRLLSVGFKTESDTATAPTGAADNLLVTEKDILPSTPPAAASIDASDIVSPLVIITEESGKIVAGEEAEQSSLSGLLWRGVVVVLCALWASNFAAAKLVMGEPGVDSSLYAVSRFSLAALALLPGSIYTLQKNPQALDTETAKAAVVCGSWVAFGYLGQTLGLLTTTAARSCVICSLHCVFVAIIAEIWRVNKANKAIADGTISGENPNTKFDLKRLVPAIIAVTGVAIVELQGAAGGPTVGDALSIAQPIGFGMGYLQLERIMGEKPEAALPVSCIKLMVVALASLGMFELQPLLHMSDGGISEALSQISFQVPSFGPIVNSKLALGGILYTGIITTAAALWVESVAFARVPATDASIILTTEPIFAAVAGAITLGETFGTSDYVGASLIIGACVLATLIDVPGDQICEVDSKGAADGECEPPKEWPFGGF